MSETGSMKFWIPLATWLIAVIILTVIVYSFYTPSPTITVTYVVILFAGFYIMWKGKELHKKIQKRIERKLESQRAKKAKKAKR